jgi:hypothetical protein
VIPFTCHVTAVFELPETVAWKLCDSPSKTLALPGASVTEIAVGALGLVGVVVEPVPQPI